MKSYNNKTCLIVYYKANNFVLKEKDNIKRIRTEYYLLSELIKHNIPVSVPIKTNNDKIYLILYRNKLYCLYRYIAGKVYKNYYAAGAEKRAYNYGKSIALLHTGLMKVNTHKNFTIMNLLKDINTWIIDVINSKNDLLDILFINKVIKEINVNFKSKYIKLPKQLIHRDIHPANMIFLNNKLNGFIDFEIATYGIRIFDPCYCSTSILTSKFKNDKARRKWIDLLLSIFKGYNSVNKLSKTEINSIVYVLLSIESIFIAYMIRIDKTIIAKFNQNILKWIYDNKNQINMKLESLIE